MDRDAEAPEVRGYETDRAGRRLLVLANGELTLAIDPAAGGRWVTWERARPDGPPQQLLRPLGSPPPTAPAVLTSEGGAPEIQAALGPASPSGLADHFLPLGTTQVDFARGAAREIGTFAAAAWEAEQYAPARGQAEVALQSVGGLRGARRITPLTVLKKITLGSPESEINIHYRIENPGTKPVQVLFGVEICFALDAAAQAAEGVYEIDGARQRGGYDVAGVAAGTTSVALRDPQPGVTIRLGWERPARVWISPSPAGATGAAVAGASVLPIWDLRLPAEDNWAVNLWVQAGPSGPVAPLPPELIARVARRESEDEPWK